MGMELEVYKMEKTWVTWKCMDYEMGNGPG